MSRQISFVVSEELASKLDAFAERTNRDIAKTCRIACEQLVASKAVANVQQNGNGPSPVAFTLRLMHVLNKVPIEQLNEAHIKYVLTGA